MAADAGLTPDQRTLVNQLLDVRAQVALGESEKMDDASQLARHA